MCFLNLYQPLRCVCEARDRKYNKELEEDPNNKEPVRPHSIYFKNLMFL